MTTTLQPERAEAPAGLVRDVGHGAVWAAASNILLRIAGLAITALLAHILAPADFGVYAVALAVHVVISSLAELGMGSAVARSAMEPEDIAPTVATISIAVSLGLAGLMATSADLLAGVLGVPEAAPSLRVLALCLGLTGFFAVPGAQLTREFRQRRIFLATAAGFVPSNAVLVVLALDGSGATAFAWSRVVGQLVTGLVMVAGLRRHYRPGWRRSLVRPLLLFGVPLAVANLVNWALLNADYVLIARLLSPELAGVYALAFAVANWTTAVLGSVINGVVLPAFGRFDGDPRGFSRALTSATGLVALVALPIGAVTFVLADPLVRLLYGERWVAAIPVLEVLAVYGVLFAFSLLLVNVLVATGRTTRLLLVQLAWIAVLVPAMVVGARTDGLVGAAWAHVVTITLVALPAYVVCVRRAIGVPVTGLPGALAGPALAAGAAAAVAWSVAHVTGPLVLQVLLGGVSAVLVYLALAARALVRLVPGAAERITERIPERISAWIPGPAPTRPGPRRLTFVLEGLAFGGCPVNAIDLARELRDRGHRVQLLAVDEEVRVSILPYAGRAGFEVGLLARDAGLLARSREIRRAVRAHRSDVVHAFAAWLGPAAVLGAVGPRRRGAVVLNWTMENAYDAGRWTPLIVGTEQLRTEAEARLRRPVWLLEPPVDTDHDRPDADAGRAFREAYGIGHDELLLTLVGRVDAIMKLPGILAAIEATERLADPRVRLAVVGDGNAMDVVRARAAQANAALGREAVVLTGSLVDPHPAYAAADVGLAMGGSALRVLAHGTPLVVLGENGFVRPFTPETAGHFLDEGFFGTVPDPDPAGTIASVVAGLADPDLRRRLGAHGRETVEARFGLRAGADRLEEIYQAALQGAPSPAARLGQAAYLWTRGTLRTRWHALRARRTTSRTAAPVTGTVEEMRGSA